MTGSRVAEQSQPDELTKECDSVTAARCELRGEI